MNVIVTTFSNPFSFFCKMEEHEKEFSLMENKVDYSHFTSHKNEVTDMKHGQYVAVIWKGKWTRGVVSMESQFLIWLIDYGIYLRPTNKTVYIDLPMEYKKYPTKVFEASIHGVIPLDKVMTDDCQIKNEISNTWNMGAVNKAKSLILSATNTYFVPIALLSTKNNDIVLGDLYLKTSDKVVNLVDELELWPVFLEKDEEKYIENLEIYYTTRKRHRACSLKPEFPDLELPKMTISTTLAEYNTIYASSPQFEPETVSEDGKSVGSTVIDDRCKNKQDERKYKLTPEEIEKYSCMHIKVNGREYNVLNVVLNKARDLHMCERYKDHDLKSVGRANTRSPAP